ncbi:hypothetical protein SAMN05660841_02185 [Sphingobacterium nematocida]|uniref:Uncharacterized protein n=1 Tax=Sphingobacterium nematocida TaxID=1513896 RepID=A0A1T5DX45_9SPHI|nr:hypothetical protein SAMN05660841_02185 [Sphingobacterium nematocida]
MRPPRANLILAVVMLAACDDTFELFVNVALNVVRHFFDIEFINVIVG